MILNILRKVVAHLPTLRLSKHRDLLTLLHAKRSLLKRKGEGTSVRSAACERVDTHLSWLT